MSLRWARDPGIGELIEYFDQPGIAPDPDRIQDTGWARLVNYPKELEVVTNEIARCREDFPRAARNYFWITTKERMDIPFRLKESQELIYERMQRMKSAGRAQKLLILKARQLGALDPSTKVLTAKLEWVEIDKLGPGDEVVSVDEFPPGGKGFGRSLRTATILDKWSVEKEAFEIRMDNGKALIATADHPFLCQRRGGVEAIWRNVAEPGPRQHASTRIIAGDKIRIISDTWHRGTGFDDGWFAGLLDGEGSLRQKENGGIEACVSQVDGAVLTRAKEYLTSRGYPFRIEVDNRKSGESSKLGNQPVYKLVLNSMSEVFRLLGTLWPSRFAERRPWEGKDLPSNGHSWSTVLSVRPIGKRRMVDIRTSTATFIAEGFVTHNCSTLIEALIAWRIMFFRNVNALIVSNTPAHGAYLFGMMTHIYEMVPWWLKPMVRSHRIEDGLVFNNPESGAFRARPGLNSMVQVQSANQLSGVGQGITVTAAHLSELSDYNPKHARQIIEGDLGHALSESPETFAVIESTAKGANTYFSKLWDKNVELAEDAGWEPLFLPWFFEGNRVRKPSHKDWRPHPDEASLRERIAREWGICSDRECGYMMEAVQRHVNILGTTCRICKKGTFVPYILTDSQLNWHGWHVANAAKDSESLKELRQEICSTAEEAFQISGIQIFPQETFDFINATIRQPFITGYIDQSGILHGIRQDNGLCPVEGCKIEHQHQELFLKIWELPKEGYRYTVGVDVSEGLGGDYDHSVAAVNKIGHMGQADAIVAVFRSNTIKPIEFSYPVAYLGRMYNEAMLSIEINRYDTTYSYVKHQLQYSNLYHWKRLDANNQVTNRWGWWTDMKSKPRLWQTAVHWLRARNWIIPSRNFLEEMRTFNKETAGDRTASASGDATDDELMACMIALYCSHDTDWDESMGLVPVAKREVDPNFSAWRMECLTCNHVWGMEVPNASFCMECGSPRIAGKRNSVPVFTSARELWNEAISREQPESEQDISYEML